MVSTHHRARRGALAAASVALVTLGLTVPSAVAEPDRAATVAEVEQAFHAAAAANEEVNQLDADVARTQADIASLDAEISGIQTTYDEQRAVLGAAIVQQQIDTPLGPTASLLGSDDPEAFLDGLSAVQAFNSSQTDALESFGAVSADLATRKAQMQQLEATLQTAQADAAARKAEVQSAYSAAKAKLDRLDAAQQAEFTRASSSVEVAGPVEASGRAGSAMEFALAQVGKAYNYGGTGPGAYDCSGLTQAAFRATGVSIPRVAGAQYSASTNVPMNQLQPGDLVFYGDMSHVGMYIGNGQVVEAANPRTGVRVAAMSSKFTKAGRFG